VKEKKGKREGRRESKSQWNQRLKKEREKKKEKACSPKRKEKGKGTGKDPKKKKMYFLILCFRDGGRKEDWPRFIPARKRSERRMAIFSIFLEGRRSRREKKGGPAKSSVSAGKKKRRKGSEPSFLRSFLSVKGKRKGSLSEKGIRSEKRKACLIREGGREEEKVHSSAWQTCGGRRERGKKEEDNLGKEATLDPLSLGREGGGRLSWGHIWEKPSSPWTSKKGGREACGTSSRERGKGGFGRERGGFFP